MGFYPSQGSNGPYWNSPHGDLVICNVPMARIGTVSMVILSFAMFQWPVLEQSSWGFVLHDVPMTLIGTVFMVILSFTMFQ